MMDNLNLPMPATPESASWFAEMGFIMAMEGWEVILDRTPTSLAQIDDLIEKLRSRRYPDLPYDLFCLGCYTGEMFVRHTQGKWVIPSELGLSAYAHLPLVIQLGKETYINPIDKVFKRFENSAEDSLMAFYDVMVDLSANE